jgi:hypothetical protein
MAPAPPQLGLCDSGRLDDRMAAQASQGLVALGSSLSNATRSRMRLAALVSTVLWVTVNQANAFALDGLFSGMTTAQAVQRLRDVGLSPHPTGFHNEVVGGVYTLRFCKNGNLNFVVKQIDAKEFNGYLADNKAAKGQPTVDIPSLDEDVLWLRWLDTNSNGISLNSGMSDRRWHAIVEVDNTVCDK